MIGYGAKADPVFRKKGDAQISVTKRVGDMRERLLARGPSASGGHSSALRFAEARLDADRRA